MIGIIPDSRLRHDPLGDSMIHIITAQRRIAAGGQHLEHAAVETQQGNIEGSAAEVVDRIHALRVLIQAIGNRRRRGLIQQPQGIKSGKTRGVFRGLALGIVKIRRHGNDRIGDFRSESFRSATLQAFQDLGGYGHRALFAGHGVDTGHGRVARREFIGKGLAQTFNVFDAAAHQSLHRRNGIERVFMRYRHGVVTHHRLALVPVAHHRGQQMPAVRIRQGLGHAATHTGHQRIGGAEIDPDRITAFVRRGRLSRFADLKQSHIGLI